MTAEAKRLPAFKAYDIRGRIPDEVNGGMATRIGRAFATFLHPRRVVVGHDIRLSSPELAHSLSEGLLESGVEVLDIGLCGTEMVYFATFHLEADGGIMITASHNPADYNGLKLVREGSRPISADTGLKEIEQIVVRHDYDTAGGVGRRKRVDVHDEYVEHLLGYVDSSRLKPLKIVVNAGNGGAGRIIDRLEEHLPFEFVKLFHEPDGSFPNGIPNPLLPDNRQATIDAVRTTGADLGIAWDGDYDRCFLFDEQGQFIEGYYIVGLLAQKVLERHAGAKIVHDPRMTWNTIEIVEECGGTPVLCKSGHAFMKEMMRREDAYYGGEMSAHHFFRDFSYCDSGMIPWMLVAELMCATGEPLSRLVGDRMQRFPASGEINRAVADKDEAIRRVRERYEPEARVVDETDGIGMEFADWRFNLRKSNTEDYVRLNAESRGDRELMERKTAEVLQILDQVSG
jgi:phosphomannomutase/phosphomannomutase/phosphoglucomutase